MKHLDADSFQSLDAGDPEATAYFAAHLQTDCDTCAEFLATQDAGGLDGLTDAALSAHAEAPLDEVGFARVRRGLRGPAPRWQRAVVGASAVAAAVLVAVVAAPKLWRSSSMDMDTDAETGVKGPQALSLELSAALRSPAGVWAQVGPGAQVADDQVIVLRYRSTAPAVGLVLEDHGPGTEPRVLGRFQLKAGTHDLGGDAEFAGVSVRGERAQYRLWLVAKQGSEPPSATELAEALRGQASDAVTAAVVPIEVVAGQDRAR